MRFVARYNALKKLNSKKQKRKEINEKLNNGGDREPKNLLFNFQGVLDGLAGDDPTPAISRTVILWELPQRFSLAN